MVSREETLNDTIKGIAGQLVAEHMSGAKFHRLPGMNDLADAYQVQNNYVAAIIGTDHGAGYKIGLTSKRSGARSSATVSSARAPICHCPIISISASNSRFASGLVAI